VVAGPVIMTGSPLAPAQAMESSPPRMLTRTGDSSRPRRMPATDGGAGAGAAGQGLAGAALVDTQADRVAVDHLHEAGIDPARKARVRFDQRSLFGDRRGIDVGHHLHRVRVAHRYALISILTPSTSSGCTAASVWLSKGISAGWKRGAPMSTVTCPSASRRGAIMPDLRFDADLALVGEALLMDEAHEAARAVAALLDLAAVGVEDAVAEIDARRGWLRSTTRIWSQPTPKWRSARKRAWAGVGTKSWLIASSTTKSLPRPCILVKRIRIGRGYAVPGAPTFGNWGQ
jgi:hypothetical protein